MTTDKPEITKGGLASMQVCVPTTYTNEEVEVFANSANFPGLKFKWKIRQKGSKALAGDPERQECEDRKGYVHIMLDC